MLGSPPVSGEFAPLEGSVVVMTGADTAVGRGLALAVAGAGARVALLGRVDGLVPVLADLEARGARAVAVGTTFSAREEIEEAFGTAADELGGRVTGVVHAWVPARAFERGPFEAVDDAQWHDVWEGTMRAALFVLQAGYTQMTGAADGRGGGRFVFVTPTIAMSGAELLVPYTAAVEGQRLLAKSAARQWGPVGITVNCVAPAPELVPVGVASMAVSLAPPALGGPGDPEADLGSVAVYLLSDASAFVTGVTICADGGVWMAP
jgi:NAD(P)-dependent dehydrogenase (short-subunit alcohol dehydrogenase family)